MQYFTTQLRDQQQQTSSLRASRYKKERKAKVTQGEEDELSEEDETKVPPAPFPHAPAKPSRDRYGSGKVQEAMEKPPSRLFAVNAGARDGSLMQQKDKAGLKRTHLNNLSTLMHHCLLQGDYERAGRAWGIILRTQVAGGRSVDPRNHGRWGIGAELLLHRKPRTQDQNTHGGIASTTTTLFSDEGFELAREYYERLIVQYPNRRTRPHSVDERMFYPAMFSLWIFQVCEKSRHARLELQTNVAEPSRSSRSTSFDSVLGDHNAEHNPTDIAAEEDAVQMEELTRAMEIAERLDQLIASPPFDRQTSLLQLRGNVALWISDLTIGKTDLDEDTEMNFTNDESRIEPSAPAAELTRIRNGQRELQQAQTFFQRAVTNGAKDQAAALASIDVRLRELSRALQRLNSAQQSSFGSFE